MKTTPRFDRAYNALVQSFFNGTLAKGSCSCCAVGNIVAASHNAEIKIIRKDDGVEGVICGIKNNLWKILFVTVSSNIGDFQFTKRHLFRDGIYYGQLRQACELPCSIEMAGRIQNALSLIAATGYSEDELAEVEFAFETNTMIRLRDYHHYSEQEILEDQYKGLCAVFEVLCRLDEVEGVDYKSELNKKFTVSIPELD